MMLNSSNKYKKLILALVCGSVSYSAMGKVYSWRDADGAMHYSQFPRQIVEKNAAQSRASRKQADLEEVVSELSEPDNSNLLDGLDDIVANASTLREQDKILKRRDPQLLLIEKQLAKQLAQEQASQAAQEKAATAVVASLAAETNEIKTVKKRLAQNSFMAGVHKRVYGQAKQNQVQQNQSKKNSEPEIQQIAAVTATSNSPQRVAPVKAAPSRSTNRFLAGIQNKLNRKSVNQDRLNEKRVEQSNVTEIASVASTAVTMPVNVVQPKIAVQPEVVAQSKTVAAPVTSHHKAAPAKATNSFLAGIQNKLKRNTVSQSSDDDTIPSVDTIAATTNVAATKKFAAETITRKHKSTNPFLAGIKNKLNRHNTQPVQQDEPVSIVSQPKPVNEFVQEDMQNKFLAEINRKLLKARLGAEATQPVAASDDVGSNSNARSNKNLIKSADKIKAIESEIGSSNKSNTLKPTTSRQDDSTLMLSRLNNSHTGRLPMTVAGSDQLDRQGIDASSQFVREVNRNAEK